MERVSSDRRTMALTVLAVLALAQAAPFCRAEPAASQPARVARFLAIADPHFRDMDKHPASLNGFRTFLAEARHLRPDFVVILGDVCGEDPPALAQTRRIADESGLKVHFVRGNHDNLESYTAAFGQTDYSFDHAGWRFILHDSISPKAGWLASELSKAPPDTPIVLCQHYMPTARLHRQLPGHRVVLALSGDIHAHRHGMVGQLRDVNLPPFGGGLAVVDLLADGRTAIAWRPRGVSRRLVIVHPADGGEIPPGPTTLLVNAFDSCREVVRVEYDAQEGFRPMTPGAGWSWTARTDARDGKLIVRATDSAGETWTATSAYRPGAAAPAVRLGADWPVPAGGPDNRRCAVGELAPPLRLTWHTAVGGRCQGPVLAAGRLFLTASTQDLEDNNAVICLDAATGRELWRVRLPLSMSCPPAVHSGVVGAVDQFGHAYGFDCRTGRQLWRLDRIAGTYGPDYGKSGMITAADGVFYVGNLHAIGAETGRQLWQSQGAGSAERLPAVAAGRLIGAGTGWYRGLDVRDGSTLWEHKFSGYRPPIILGQTAILSGATIADVVDGREVRKLSVNRDGADCAVSADGKVLLTQSGNYLVATSLDNGEMCWRFPLPRTNPGLSGLAVAGGYAWLTTSDGVLRAVNMNDGTQTWSLPVGVPLGPPTISGNALFVAAQDGQVFAFTGPVPPATAPTDDR